MAANPRDNAPAVRRRTRKTGRRLVLLVGLLAVAVAAGGGWYFWHARKAVVSARPTQPVYVAIKPFVVTVLDDSQATRFVQVGVDLEVAGSDGAERVRQVLPAIEDAIRLEILQSKVGEVTSPQGVERLRKVLIAHANDAVATVLDPPSDAHKLKPGQPSARGPVRNLYFTELVVE
ncbi:MAG: flagellar basal body-associated FliL family protein [Alphaproteobacteria bacterium]|nr:flagellar basal body-associated FliL family protein [Alphaproteobacteria bacterium]